MRKTKLYIVRRPSKKMLIVYAVLLSILTGIGVVVFLGDRQDFAIVPEDKVNEESDIEGEKVVGNDGSAEEELPIPKKEFTEFGNFWIEIERDGLKVKAPIVDGVDKESLKRGVGHHGTTAVPNPDSGNIVISGHRWIPGRNPAYTAFRHIDKLELGDKVSLFYDNKEYVYRVRESKTVSGDAVEILEQTDAPQLTLYTCTPLFTALKRLVYIADFIEVRDT